MSTSSAARSSIAGAHLPTWRQWTRRLYFLAATLMSVAVVVQVFFAGAAVHVMSMKMHAAALPDCGSGLARRRAWPVPPVLRPTRKRVHNTCGQPRGCLCEQPARFRALEPLLCRSVLLTRAANVRGRRQ